MGGLAIGPCDTLGKIKDMGIHNGSQIVSWLSHVKISEQMDDDIYFRVSFWSINFRDTYTISTTRGGRTR